MIVDTPLRLTLIPPPGAPELCRTLTPANLPFKAASSVWTGAPTNSSPLTEATAFAAFLRLTEEARPVTRTSSPFNTSTVISTETVEDAEDTSTS